MNMVRQVGFIRSIVLVLSIIFSVNAFSQTQGFCVIRGKINKEFLRFSPSRKVQKLFLQKVDEYDRFITVDSAHVKNKRFEFSRALKDSEPVELYFITGFDNGNVQVFLEEGVDSVYIPDAAYPNGASVHGTKTNELYNEYKSFTRDCVREQKDSLKLLLNRYGRTWMDSPDGITYRNRIGAEALIKCNMRRIEFLLAHNDSPLSPLMMEREVSPLLDKAYAKKLLYALSPVLKGHPYYRSYANKVKAMDLLVGSELPDITLPLLNGEKKKLSDFKGKYVLLDFWASWCAPCRRDMPGLVKLFNETDRSKLTFVSFSLDTDREKWMEAILQLDMQKKGWIHSGDLLGWNSPSAKLLGVEAIPKAILIDPEGRAISFTLRGEELSRRVKQILSGDLYYQNKENEDSKTKMIQNAK